MVWHTRLLPAALLVVAGASKLVTPRGFAEVLALYFVLPPQVTQAASYALAIAEVLLGICIAIGIGKAVSFRLGQMLLVIFALALSAKLIQGEVIPCGCFGTDELISWHMVGRNVGLVLILEASLQASQLLAPGTRIEQGKSLLYLAFATGAAVLLPILAPVLGAGLDPQATLVASGAAMYGYGPLPGDYVELGGQDQRETGKTLVVFLGDDISSVYLQGWLRSAASELREIVDHTVVWGSSDEAAFRMPAPGLLVVNSDGRVLFRWQPLGLWSWSKLTKGLRNLEHSLPENDLMGVVGLRRGGVMANLRVLNALGEPITLRFGNSNYAIVFLDLHCSICVEVSNWLAANHHRLPDSYVWIAVITGAGAEDTLAEVAGTLADPAGGSIFTGLGMETVSTLRTRLPMAVRKAQSAASRLGLPIDYYLDLDYAEAVRLGLWRIPCLLVVENGRLVADCSIGVSYEPTEVDLLDYLFKSDD
ncbi:MAG: MauE/DoxX family redox-associated membrane protein [Bacillota bacterium]